MANGYAKYSGIGGGGAGSGTVTSVSLSLPNIFNVSGSPVTSSGTITATLATESANTVFAGPTSGGATTPTFRALVAADIPSLSATYVTQSEIGVANGVAALNSSGKIPVSYLPSSVLQYEGTWNPSTNTPTLADSSGTAGYVYWVSAATAGPISGLNNASMYNFQIGDVVIYNGTQWELTTPAAGVQSVNGMQGVVTIPVFSASVNGLAPLSGGGTVNYLRADGTWDAPPGATSGTVTSVSVVTANGFAGTVATSTTTPAITISTPVTGILYGNGTSIAAAIAGNFPTLNQNTTGVAANITATSNSTLTTLSALSLPGSQVTGNISGNAANITATSNSTLTTLSALSLPTSQLSGLITVPQGGTGLGTLTANNVILGNGTSTPLFVAPGTSGNVLTSNGTTWVSSSSSSSNPITLTQISTPSNPPSGSDSLYFKSDDNLYILNSSGVETLVGGSSGAIFESAQVTTLSSAVTSGTYVTFSNSPAFTFTPTISGTYKVYAPATIYVNAAGVLGNVQIINTSGGATLLYNNESAVYGGAGADITTGFTLALYTLTANTSYVFDLQGRVTSGVSLFLAGNYGEFYMFAELVGGAGGGSGANVTLSNLTSPTAINQDLLPTSNFSNNLGSASDAWNTIYVGNITGTASNLPIVTSSIGSGSTSTSPINIDTGNISGSGTGGTGGLNLQSGNITNTSSTNVTGSISIKSGSTLGTNASGQVSIFSGNAGNTGANSGNLVLQTGSAGNNSGSVLISTGTTSGGGTCGNITLTPGTNATAGVIQLNAATTIGTTSTTLQHSLNTSLGTNGAGTGTLLNLPSGASGSPTGYISILINGTTRYIPFW